MHYSVCHFHAYKPRDARIVCRIDVAQNAIRLAICEAMGLQPEPLTEDAKAHTDRVFKTALARAKAWKGDKPFSVKVGTSLIHAMRSTSLEDRCF